MAKSSRKSKDEAGVENKTAAPETTSQASADRDPPAKPLAAKSALSKPAKAAGRASAKPRSTGPRKTAPTSKPRGTARKRAATNEAVISDDAIRLRAYFISERRAQEGRAGDSAHDWLEARRQLQEEAGNRA